MKRPADALMRRAEPLGPLFSAAGGARRSDPDSSHQAADAAERSGLARQQREQVLALVRAYPGRTSAELAALSPNLNRYQVARRLPELAERGLVRRGPPRTCCATGSACITWIPEERA